MAMVLIKQLNYDVCDKINKVAMEDYKRQKIDDYEKFINHHDDDDDFVVEGWKFESCFYKLEIYIDFRNELESFTGSDKDDMFKKFQIVKDYMNLNIDDNILSVKLLMKRAFVNMAGYFCWASLDQDPEIIDFHNVPTNKYDAIYNPFDEDDFIYDYNEMKELYDNGELEFYEFLGADINTIINFNKW